MFIKYQKVRNTVLGTVAAVGTGIAALFGFGGGADSTSTPRTQRAHQTVANQQAPLTHAPTTSTAQSEAAVSRPAILAEQDPASFDSDVATNSLTSSVPPTSVNASPAQEAAVTPEMLYVGAMELAMAKADPSGKGKDVLGPASPWKLNLYDDNQDGQWDRAKLDTNRDDIDDEKWNFKKGRWEKDGGNTLWLGGRWVRASETTPPQIADRAQPNVALYKRAMQIANAPADPSGKGKDVLGASSPWKLNLYDDDRDGVWERGKLDRNRDEVDDEKWNFKNGRWEKDGGSTIWKDNRWQPSS